MYPGRRGYLSGDAAVAVNAGFLNGADLSEAEHGVYYAWSPYRDAWRKYKDHNRLKQAAKNAEEIREGVVSGSTGHLSLMKFRKSQAQEIIVNLLQFLTGQ